MTGGPIEGVSFKKKLGGIYRGVSVTASAAENWRPKKLIVVWRGSRRAAGLLDSRH